jgi:cytochrome c2
VGDLSRLISIGLISIVPAIMTAAIGADVSRGRALFVACASCHNSSPDAVGPSLSGVIGRRAAVVPSFRYSRALRESGLTWTKDQLSQFLTSPQALVPGNRMAYDGLGNSDDVLDLIAYLSTL